MRCVPADHPYVVRAIGPQGEPHDGLVVLPEITGADGLWWPPALFDPVRREAALGGVDVVHVHFGVEQVPLHDMRATSSTCSAAAVINGDADAYGSSRPSMYTVPRLASSRRMSVAGDPADGFPHVDRARLRIPVEEHP